MKKFTHAASILALTLAASSAYAWYAPPYQAGAMTDEQKQAVADQQQAMAAQYAKAAEQAMATQQEMARRAAEQQAAYFAEMQKNASQGAPEAPMVADPFAGNPFGPVTGRPDFPAMPEMPGFADREFPAMPEMPAFEHPAMSEFPAMPEMPAFQRRAMPQFPAMPEMPGFADREFPAMPEMPAFERPAMPEFPAMPQMPNFERPAAFERGARAGGYRGLSRQEMDARRAALRDMREQRRAARHFGPGNAAYMPHAMMSRSMGCGPAATAATAPKQPEAAPKQAEATPVAPAAEAAPAQQ